MHSLLNTLRTRSPRSPDWSASLSRRRPCGQCAAVGIQPHSQCPTRTCHAALIVSLIVACIVALRYRWTPVVGALACVAQLVEGFIFLDLIVAAIDGGTTLIYATLFFALAVFGLVVCVALSLQGLRVAPGGTVHPREASHWTYPVVLLIVMLLTAVVLQSAVMARTATADTSGAVLVGLPVLMSRNTRFELVDTPCEGGRHRDIPPGQRRRYAAFPGHRRVRRACDNAGRRISPRDVPPFAAGDVYLLLPSAR